MVKIEQRQQTLCVGVGGGRCARPPFLRRPSDGPSLLAPGWGRFFETGMVGKGPGNPFSKIGGDQIIRTLASTNINPGCSGANQIPITIEDVQKTRLIEAGVWLNSLQRIFLYKERCLYCAVVSPKSHGTPRWVV
jgi:hypothetical protein